MSKIMNIIKSIYNYTADFRYIAVIYDSAQSTIIIMTKLRSDFYSWTTTHISKLRASYGVSCVSYKKPLRYIESALHNQTQDFTKPNRAWQREMFKDASISKPFFFLFPVNSLFPRVVLDIRSQWYRRVWWRLQWIHICRKRFKGQ